MKILTELRAWLEYRYVELEQSWTRSFEECDAKNAHMNDIQYIIDSISEIIANVNFLERRTCRDCKNEFNIEPSEAKWYKNNGLQLPIRCYPCRKKRKAEKKNAE